MRTYKISINGYGSEVTIGSVNEDIKKILNNPDKELVEAVDEDVKKLTTRRHNRKIIRDIQKLLIAYFYIK